MTDPRRRLVCHVSPTYFAAESFIGGGERFAEELARAMAARDEVDVRFVSFGQTERRHSPGPGLERVILRNWTRRKMTPFSPRLWRELRDADVIHCHQMHVLSTFLAAAYGHWRRKAVFVTDLGGGGWTPGYQFDITRWISAQLPISHYAARGITGRNRRYRVIYGGVDLARYAMRAEGAHDGSIVFLGRLLPHKGVHFLIEGLPADVPLDVVGPAVDRSYCDHLKELARGKAVRFLTDLDDEQVIARLRHAAALVHPTPTDASGSPAAHELLGLAPLEAMACGCPVIASDAASLPELVQHDRSGLLVAPNQPAALGAAILGLVGDSQLWRRLSRGARERVESMFTWNHVVARCLAAYAEAPC